MTRHVNDDFAVNVMALVPHRSGSLADAAGHRWWANFLPVCLNVPNPRGVLAYLDPSRGEEVCCVELLVVVVCWRIVVVLVT